MHYYIDDGVIFYVNGVEVGNYHCISGSTYKDYSTAYESNVAYYGTIDIPTQLLKKGKNVITAEAHNTSASSSDMFFDARLTKSVSESSMISTQEELVLNEDIISGSCQLVAMYEKLDEPSKGLESGATPVRINEVSAGNSIFINDHYKKNDWVELYNTTDKDIDVSGMYLSDNRNNPQKYQINADGSIASTIVPAYGRLIVWCDKLAPISQLHAPFKLDNADGAYIILQAEDGTWCDELEYLEQDDWQTYGRYPDGGRHVSYQSIPSIALPNMMGVYDFSSENATYWGDSLMAITLGLEKGWNWISHNLDSKVHVSRFTGYAQHVVGQYESYVKAKENLWNGNLKVLDLATGYKVRMTDATDITLRGNLFDVETPVSVKQGWNWLGCPLYNTTTIDVALEQYHPTEGDAIVGINGFATYEEGRWVGTLSSLSVGQAYLLKCNKEQTFCWNSLSTPTVRKAKRYRMPEKDLMEFIPWQVDVHAYPNVTNVIATMAEPASDNCVVAAFCGEECRGISQQVEGLLYMNIHGEGGETLHLKFMDEQGGVSDIEQTIVLTPENIIGSRKMPFQLTMKGSDVVELLSATRVISTTYYTPNGVQVSKPASGVFVEKIVYENGKVVTRKIVR